MEKERIAEINENVISFINAGRLKDAITSLGEGIDDLQDWSLRTRFNQMQTSYNYLLEYMRNGTPDPTREDIYRKLLGDCLLLNEQISVARLTEGGNTFYFYNRRKYKNLDDLEKTYNSLGNNTEKRELASIMNIKNKTADMSLEEEHEQLLDTIYNMIWCSSNWQKGDAELINKMIDDVALNADDRALIISAVTLSLLNCFEPVKVITLVKATTNEETQLVARAIVGTIIVLYANFDKIKYYPELIAAIESMRENVMIRRCIEKAQVQLLYCRETVKIDRKMREEIIPAMLKNPNLDKDKLGIDIIGENYSDEDKNPEWEKWLEKNKIKKKLEEMSNWQSEGADLYISTFSQLKRFPFFNSIKNWLRPFSLNIPAIANAVTKDLLKKNNLLNCIFSSTNFCNSDKFSFCLAFQNIHKDQMDMFAEDILEDEDINSKLGITPKLSPEEQVYAYSNMYIQDLYRFFRISSFGKDFCDPFSTSLNLMESEYLSPLVSSPDALLHIFNHLANKCYYNEAIFAGEIYESHIYNGDRESTDLFYQKMGYCFQKEERYDEAIEYYTRADIIRPNSPWTLQHIAQCHRLNGEINKALNYYLMAEEINPDSLPLLRQTGECLTALKQYDEAFARFFKLEYLNPGNINALRAIAWCSFLTKKEEQARSYYQKIFEQEKGSFIDYMNAAHVEWIAHNNMKAIELYKRAKEICGDDAKFFKTFNKDRIALDERGITFDEFNMLRDLII